MFINSFLSILVSICSPGFASLSLQLFLAGKDKKMLNLKKKNQNPQKNWLFLRKASQKIRILPLNQKCSMGQHTPVSNIVLALLLDVISRHKLNTHVVCSARGLAQGLGQTRLLSSGPCHPWEVLSQEQHWRQLSPWLVASPRLASPISGSVGSSRAPWIPGISLKCCSAGWVVAAHEPTAVAQLLLGLRSCWKCNNRSVRCFADHLNHHHGKKPSHTQVTPNAGNATTPWDSPQEIGRRWLINFSLSGDLLPKTLGKSLFCTFILYIAR